MKRSLEHASHERDASKRHNPGQYVQGINNEGSSRTHIGHVFADTVNNYHGAVPSGSKRDDERWDSFEKALAFDRMDLRRAAIEPAYGDTCRWIIETKQFLSWRNEAYRHSHHGFFWIKGKPGVGKSTAMKFLLGHLKTAMPSYTVLSFFFYARGRPLESSVEGLYRSLLLQLLVKFPGLRNAMDVPHLRGAEQNLELATVQDMFREAVDHLQQERLILIIDALDEGCHDEVRTMVRYLEGLVETARQREQHLDICFASRHYPSISVRHCEDLVVEHRNEHSTDIKTYVCNCLVTGVGTRYAELRGKIIQKCQSVFLWVVLVVSMLNERFDKGARFDQLMETLDAMPASLSNLLDRMLYEGAENRYFLPSLQWVLAGRIQDIDIHVLYHGVRLAVGELDTPVWDRKEVDIATMERFILHSSKGLIECVHLEEDEDDGLETIDVRFIHESVRQHLLGGGLQKLDASLGINVMANSHAMLASWCQDYVKLDIPTYLGIPMDSAGGILDADGLEHEDKSILQRRTEDAHYKFPLLAYVQASTFYHIETAHAGKAYKLDALKEFPLQQWINANNLFDIDGSHLRPSTNVMFLCLLGRCHSVAKELLMHYKLCLTQASDDEVDVRIACSCDIHAFIGPSLDLVYANRSGTLLMAATSAYDTTACRLLLDCGADVNFAANGGSPLTEAIKLLYKHQTLDLVRLFLDAGANVELANHYHESPLAVAAATWRTPLDVVQLLLDRGANVNSLGGPHRSPLGAAACSGDIEMAKLLLAHGADLNEKDDSLYSVALRQAIEGNDPARVDDMLSLLLSDHRARVSTQDLQNLLLLASRKLVPTAIPALIRYGADPNGEDVFGRIALHVAAAGHYVAERYSRSDKFGTVDALLEHGADVDAKSGQHETVLILASAKGDLHLVLKWLGHEADVHHRSKAFGTALEAARAGRHRWVVTVLSQAGARDVSREEPLAT